MASFDLNLILTLMIVAGIGLFINARIPGSSGIKTAVNVALALIVVGVLLFLVNTYVPMAGSIRAILNVVVFLTTCIKVLQVFGFWDDVVRTWNGLIHRATESHEHQPQ